jgi:hypothetical protein
MDTILYEVQKVLRIMAMARFGFANQVALIVCFKQEVGAELKVSVQDLFT